MHRELKDHGLTVLAVNIGEKKGPVLEWVGEKKPSFTVLVDEGGAVTQAYRVVATPTVFLIGPDGKIAGKAIGPKKWDSEAGKAALRALAAR